MQKRAQTLALTALTSVLAVLLCLAQTASGAITPSLEKIASGEFFEHPTERTQQIQLEAPELQWSHTPSPTKTVSGRGRWLSPDPLGEAGGINLYGYVGNDPINMWDALGLCPGSGGKFNYSKAIVATGNALNAARLAAAGMTKIVVGTGGELTGVGAAPGAAVTGMGVWNIMGSKAAMQRSFKQWDESWNDDRHWDKKNFWGLAPFGDKIDDDCEPYVGHLAGGVARNLASDPIGFTKDVASKTDWWKLLQEVGTFGF
ncbi:RHS repeat-associated core domain-containing protein [Luteolibacter algae]|uniref:RHS repeat-associated core domain-containing protein n=1 Tax=Luteolibacter algae TaxID=454151 RepID=A0ABW5D753_9BACT